MANNKLLMLLLGCKPKGRHTEQHDVFFTIGKDLKSIIPDIEAFWPDGGRIHIDAWQTVEQANGFNIKVTRKKKQEEKQTKGIKLFFLNLGGYKPGDFEEYHYKMVVAAPDKSSAIKIAKASAFYQHTGFKGAESHIDDKYGIDVDDFYEIEDILPAAIRERYRLVLKETKNVKGNESHIGYTNLSKIK